MNHCCQVLKYLVDIPDVGLQLGDGALPLVQVLQVLLLLQDQLRLD